MSDEQDNNEAGDGLDDIDFSPAGEEASDTPAPLQTSLQAQTSLTDELEEMVVSEEISNKNQDSTAEDLEAIFDVPVRVSVVLGRTKMPISSLLNMNVGTVVELDRQVGEAIDIHVNDRLVARGEIVLVEDKLGVTMTEIIKAS